MLFSRRSEMDRINHVKIATPDPESVDRFLREVTEFPEGWRIGGAERENLRTGVAAVSGARDANGDFTEEAVFAFRGVARGGGRITGSTESRQFQILNSDRAHIWAVALGTRNLERAHTRCLEHGFPCTDLGLTPRGDGGIGYFFAEVGGIVFEV